VLDIEGGVSNLAYSAGERLMLYVNDVQWLSAMIYGNPAMGTGLRERGHVLPTEYDLLKLAREMDDARDRLHAAARARRDEADELEFIARRLEAIGTEETLRVAELARKAEMTLRAAGGKRVLAFADLQFFESIWVGVSRAIDRGQFAPSIATRSARSKRNLRATSMGSVSPMARWCAVNPTISPIGRRWGADSFVLSRDPSLVKRGTDPAGPG
jgi:hypothetical protein